MDQVFEQDTVMNRFCDAHYVDLARTILSRDDQSEEAFLGAQAILLLNGLL
jgi:hypothetical protein